MIFGSKISKGPTLQFESGTLKQRKLERAIVRKQTKNLIGSSQIRDITMSATLCLLTRTGKQSSQGRRCTTAMEIEVTNF